MSILPYRTLERSHEATPHRIGLPASEVFCESSRACGKFFLPLLSIDLSTLNPDWQGLVHFLYGASSWGAHLFKRVDGGRRLEWLGLVESGFKPDRFDEYDLDEMGADAGFASINEGEDRGNNTLGGVPKWTQNPEVPVPPSRAPDVYFIGKIKARKWSSMLADEDIFLFYCPSQDVQMVISQCT